MAWDRTGEVEVPDRYLAIELNSENLAQKAKRDIKRA